MAMIWNPVTRRNEEMTGGIITTPNGSNAKNLLDYVVTPLKQKMKGMKSEGFTIEQIAENPEIRNMFRTHEFPSFEKTLDGIFFTPTAKVISSTQQYYVKWFSLDKDFHISHDHDYQFTRLIPNGYFMKTTLSGIKESMLLEIQYVTPVDNIKVSQIYETRPELPVSLNDDINPSNAVSQYAVQPYQIGMYPEVYNVLSDTASFINNYMQDILENI